MLYLILRTDELRSVAGLRRAQLIDVPEQLFEPGPHLLPFLAHRLEFSGKTRIRVFRFFKIDPQGIGDLVGLFLLHRRESFVVSGRFRRCFVFIAQTMYERNCSLDALFQMIEWIDFFRCCGRHLFSSGYFFGAAAAAVARAAFAWSISSVNCEASSVAVAASTLRSRSIPASLRP